VDVQAIRAQIPGLAENVYMNTGGVGPSPEPVNEALVGTYNRFQEHGPDHPDTKAWVSEQVELTRHRLARFLGVTEHELALLRSVSEGIDVVAWGRQWQPGDEVIITDQEHPTGMLPWYNLRDRFGVEVKQVRLIDDRELLLDRIERQITPRTKLLSLSHVTAENGLRLPAKEITKLAHEHGVEVLYDGAQSVGQFPIDLYEMDVDYYCITGHKWLLGGQGVGALYVRRDRLNDILISWTGSSANATLNRATGDHEWLEGARRFEFGNRFWPSYVAFGEAVAFINNVGAGVIETQAGELADTLKRELVAIPGVTVLTPLDPDLSTGIVGFEIAGLTGTEIAKHFWERWRIICRPAFEGRSVRISCAFFTVSNELQTVLEATRTLAREAGS
jgi:L-cysteine/cystine lyase